MDRASVHSDSRVDQHIFKCPYLENAPLLLLNQARDIVRYGPLAPYMSLRNRNTGYVPFFEIETNRVPEWSYDYIPPHQKTTFCSPTMPVVSDFHQNDQYCQPLHPNSLPLGRQEWMGRPVMPFPREPVSIVSCPSDLNSNPSRSNYRKPFSHSKIHRTGESRLPITHSQTNNDVCYIRQPTKYLENAHPYKTTANDIAGSFHNILSNGRDKRPTRNEINRTEEPLNLVVISNQNSNQVLPSSSSSPSSTSSSLSSLSPIVSSSSSSSSSPTSASLSTHPLSVSSLLQSASTRTPSSTSNSTHGHENIKLDQRHLRLHSRGMNYTRRECCSSMIGKDHKKQVQNINHVKNPKEKESSNSNTITDDDNVSKTIQSPICDKDSSNTFVNTSNTQHRDFQTDSRNFEYVNMLNRDRSNDYRYSISQAQENGAYSGLQQSNSRMNEMQYDLRPPLVTSAVEGGFVTKGIGHVSQGNSSTNIPPTDTINGTTSSHVTWKGNEARSAFKNTSLLHIQCKRNISHTPQTDLLTAKVNEKDPRVADDINLTGKQYSTSPISKANGCSDIRSSNQPLVSSTNEFNPNSHNNVYPSFKICPVKILVGVSRNSSKVNQPVPTTDRSILDENRPFIGQSHSVQPPGRLLIGDHRRESLMQDPVILPSNQEKESNGLEESRIKTVARVSTISNPSEFNPSNITDGDKHVNREIEEKRYYFDLNTRNVVPHSPYLSTNPDKISQHISETDVPASDHETNKSSSLSMNIHYPPYEPRSLFTPVASGESAYDQGPQEMDRTPTQVQKSQPHYPLLRRSDSDGRSAQLAPILRVGSQERNPISDSTERDHHSNPGDENTSVCNDRKYKLNCYNNLGATVTENSQWHDRTVNDKTVSAQAHSMNYNDINTETNSHNFWKNGDDTYSQTIQQNISNNEKNSTTNNNGNRNNFEISDRELSGQPRHRDESPLSNSVVTSHGDAEISALVDRSQKDDFLTTNENANDVTTSADKNVTGTNTSDANAKNVDPIGSTDSSKFTNDHSSDLPQCVYCESIFSSTELLQEHLKTHMVSTPYQCSHCSLGFVSKARLQRHMQLHMNAKPYKCDECKNLFSTVTAFHRHLHSKKHTGKNLFKCGECGLSFVSEDYINLHYKTHTGEHPFQCEQCGSIFACKNNLKNHIMTHTGEKPYQCVHCAKRFVTNFSLTVHIRTHTKEYPYRCDICNKRFLCSSNMASHLRTHTGEKKHQCYKCGKFLSSWSGLQGHQRTHTKECPFSCDLCSKSFSSKFSLRIHQRIHSGENPHKCKHCDKCFSNSSNLQRHLRTHTGEKPYHCNYCGKTFCSSTYLKSHIRIHTGEKPHTCNFCGKGFSNTSCFKQHVKNHEKA